LVEADGARVLIDAGLMDLHDRFPPGSLDAIVLTHYHPDHVQGLFHIRWGKGQPVTVFGPPDSEGCADLFKHPGLLKFETVRKHEPFRIGPLCWTPLPLIHSKPTLGYAIEGPEHSRWAYLTDTHGLPPSTAEFLQGWGPFQMAIDCSYPPTDLPKNHNDWHTAIACGRQVSAQTTWLTHLSHAVDDWLLSERPDLPEGVKVARDGLCIDLAARLRSVPPGP
jgi:phosphoribosyl 1,2-cyclic phosphate phosphodiesterase